VKYDLTDWKLEGPADARSIDGLMSSLGVALPREYVDFLKKHNGGDGLIGDNYFILWTIEDLGDFNREYQVEIYARGILLFGSSGGGQGYGFDTRSAAMPIVQVPFIGMAHEYVEPVASSFSGIFTKNVGQRASARFSVHSRRMEITEIKPVILGGDPIDPENKMTVTRRQHFELVRYWNGLISQLRGS
jgi:SMI1 / KNR4 family (SUKH-1)